MMAQPTLSNLSLGLTTREEWEDLIAFDAGGELHDPLFQGDFRFTSTEDYTQPSAPTSVVEGPSSFDYVLSAPGSVADGPSSFDQGCSWLSASPSFSTNATSPLPGRPLPAFHDSLGSLQGCDYLTSPLNGTLHSPSLDTGEQLSGSFGALTNVGGWAEQHPQLIEPIPELEHPGAIAIPQPSSFTANSTTASFHRSEDVFFDQSQARAVTIPQPGRRPASYNPGLYRNQWVQQAPPMLSVSPSVRRPRSNTSGSLSRSNSKTGPPLARTRNSLTTPSPTSNTFGWVTYQHNAQNNRLIPTGSDGSRSRRHRGRTRALTAEQRRGAAVMRGMGACSNCRKRKAKCDSGVPCRACIDYFKGDLIRNPCRDQLLANLTESLLSDRLGWHPTSRALETFLGPNRFSVSTGISYTIPLSIGFGPELHLDVNALNVEDPAALYHDHVIYSWPPSTAGGDIHKHAVLPAILTDDTVSTLPQKLDSHLSDLVMGHFRSFPLYTSPLRILREVYIFYRSLQANTGQLRILHLALKLLVLVHIGGDLTLPPASNHLALAQLVRTSMPHVTKDVTPTPCFIRSQLSAVMPGLANTYMKHVLSSLELLLLNRESNDWAVALAVVIVVLMTVESIHYHDAKLPYHHSFDKAQPSTERNNSKVDEESVEVLFKFYNTCFSGCHARLRPEWQGETTLSTPEDKFVESVRAAVKNASRTDYLKKRASEERNDGDMGWYFDRLVARLLVMH